jgi:transcription initiation factor IIE alpha subunit
MNSEMSETEEQICVPCGAIRQEVFAEAVGKGYELRTLVCPRCKSVLRFVEPIKRHRIASSSSG